MAQNYFYPPGLGPLTIPGSIDVTIVGPLPVPVSGTVTANQGTSNTLGNAWPVELTDGTNVNSFTANGLKVDGSAVTQPVSAASLPLPAGASTSANQATEIASLSHIDTSTAALNTRTAGSLTPVNYNEVALTYIASGNGTGQIGTAVYKLGGSTVKTLTLTYDSSNRLTDVLAS